MEVLYDVNYGMIGAGFVLMYLFLNAYMTKPKEKRKKKWQVIICMTFSFSFIFTGFSTVFKEILPFALLSVGVCFMMMLAVPCSMPFFRNNFLGKTVRQFGFLLFGYLFLRDGISRLM